MLTLWYFVQKQAAGKAEGGQEADEDGGRGAAFARCIPCGGAAIACCKMQYMQDITQHSAFNDTQGEIGKDG
jgi:hypothetical protein